jgi:hypothetical protein
MYKQQALEKTSLATAPDETSADRAEHDDDTIRDERPLEEMPSLTVKNMQSTSSRYGGRTLIERKYRRKSSLVPELKNTSEPPVIEGLHLQFPWHGRS